MSLILSGTNGLSDVDGSAATPAIRGTDTNTGIFFPAADTIAFAEGGAEIARFDSSGNLGLGVTPSAWGTANSLKAIQVGPNLTAYSNNSDAYWNKNWYLNSSSQTIFLNNGYALSYGQVNGEHRFYTSTASGTAGGTVSFSQLMTLDASGNLLLGTTSGSQSRIVKSISGDFVLRVENSLSTNPYVLELMVPTASANDTSYAYWIARNANGTNRAYLNGNGGLANYSANNVNLSDRREKTNFAPATSYLDKICAIPVQTFNYIDQNLETDAGLTLGVVAQDVQAVAPELVTESNWGTEEEPKMRLSVYQTDLQYALMKCIQEQQALIAQLQADVAALKGTQP